MASIDWFRQLIQANGENPPLELTGDMFSNVSTIRDYAFYGLVDPNKVTLSGDLAEEQGNLFPRVTYNNNQLIFPNSVTTIGISAFAKNSSVLTRVEFSDEFISCGSNAFNGYGVELTNLRVGAKTTSFYVRVENDNNTVLNLDFYATNCDTCGFSGGNKVTANLEAYPTIVPTFHSNVTKIPSKFGAQVCGQLTSGEYNLFPNTITTLGTQAYPNNCASNTIHIPSSVRTIQGRLVGAGISSDVYPATIYCHVPSGITMSLPTAGSLTGMCYGKSSHSITIYTDNESFKNYAWSTDNVTATFKHLDGTSW